MSEGDARGEPGEPDEGAPEEAPASSPVPPTRLGAALGVAAAVTVASALVMRFALDPARAGEPVALGAFAVLYGALAIATVLWLRRRRELALVRPASGDIALGAASAALLYLLAMGTRLLLAPQGTPREAWIVRVYLALGESGAMRLLRGPESSGPLLGIVVLCIAALEELTWRGLVLCSLERALGSGRAVVLSTLFYVLATAPSMALLRDPQAGLNPLLVLGALGGGLAWSALYLRRGRLLPAVFSHALFSWALVEFPLWHG
jgi:hypothetical protein